MRFDRQIFFEQYRSHFGAIKDQYVVDGLSRLLTGFETYWGWWDELRQIANAFAQVGWETAWSYSPVEEGYYLGDPKAPGYFTGNTATVTRFQQRLRYYPHFGRGDIQLTWAENYADMNARIRKFFPERVTEFEQRTGKKFDLIKDPEQATDPWISFCVFTIGMHLGTFRAGHNLDRYITPTKTDYFNARDIVNGDKNYRKQGKKIGTLIAEASVKFELILKASLITDQPEIAPLSEPEISALVENIAPSPNDPPSFASPDTLPAGDAAAGLSEVLAVETPAPAGDPPDATPTTFFNVEDWKNFAMRWLRRIWGIGVPANVGQATGFLTAAWNDPDNWMIYAILGGFLFIVIAGVGLLLSAGLVGLAWWNRVEIRDYLTLQLKARLDPNLKNVGLTFEKK